MTLTFRLPALALTGLVLLSACSSDAVSEDANASIHPALVQMGQISYNSDRDPADLTEAQLATLKEQRTEALFASTQIVQNTPDWKAATRELDDLARDRRFADDDVSQQIISSVALQGVLLSAPDTDDSHRVTIRHLNNLVANGGVSFEAMVAAIDKVAASQPAHAVTNLKREVAARYASYEAACSDCDLAEARVPASESDDDVFARLPASVRTQAIRSAERKSAAHQTIQDWAL